MKVKAFLDVLRPYAGVISAYGGKQLADHLEALGNVWAPAMSWNMKDLLSRAWPSEQLPEADETSVRDFREALVRLQDVVKTIAKQDQIKDLAAVVDALEPHDRADLQSFIKACQLALETVQAAKSKRRSTKKTATEPVDETRVAEIVLRLKETYKHPEQFGPFYIALSADRTLGQSDMAAIATRFAYDTPATTKKPESLRRIWLVHESYSTSAAKSKSSGGRSAA